MLQSRSNSFELIRARFKKHKDDFDEGGSFQITNLCLTEARRMPQLGAVKIVESLYDHERGVDIRTKDTFGNGYAIVAGMRE